MLVNFNPQKEIKLMVDASKVAVGGVLLQLEEHWRPIPLFEHKLLKYQLAYIVADKECLAVIIGICKYRHYLEEKEFLIVSDHHALCSLRKSNPRLARLHRWAVLLSGFRYKIVYTKGKEYPSDCLSRAEGLEMSPFINDDLFNCLLINKVTKNKLKLRGQIKQDPEEAYVNLVSKFKFID